MNPHRASPLVAGLLSSLCAGLGQMHCGRIGRGLTLFSLSVIFAPAIMASAGSPATTSNLVVVALSALSFLAVSVFSVLDALLLARRSAGSTRPTLRPAVYGVFIVAGMLYPLGAAEYLSHHVIQAYRVPTTSMSPTVQRGDRILADKTPGAVAAASYGDLVVVPRPDQPEQLLIKRIVAMPGDRIEVRRGQLVLNGNLLPRVSVPDHLVDRGRELDGEAFLERIAQVFYYTLSTRAAPAPDFPELRVPPGACFVLGDNKDKAVDSRRFGVVKLKDIEGIGRYLFDPRRMRFGVLQDPFVPRDYDEILERFSGR